MTSSRDRTSEFLKAIDILQSKQVNGRVPTKQLLQNKNEFMNIAKNISKALASSFAKLEKLSLLAKNKSLFDDKTEEIQQLTMVVREDINHLNKQIAQLQLISSNQNGYGKQKKIQSNSVVISLQSHLANMSSKFKNILEDRTENLKQQKLRRDQYNFATPNPNTSYSNQSNVRSRMLLMEDSGVGGSTNSTFDFGEGDRQRHQHQLQLINEQDSFIQSRTDAMINIEQTIVELGTIFAQLANMVKEQDEVIIRIDTNVEDAQLNVESAHTELVKYFKSVSSNRWLMIKIFGILIFFFIIFVVFLV